MVITDQLANVQGQIKEKHSTKLPQSFHQHPQALMLATTCLAISSQFTTAFLEFLASTDTDLRFNGFPDNASWLLSTKLCARLCGDLDKERSFMRDSGLDSRKEISSQSLWAILRTVCKMQEIQNYGLANYPAISAEYVKFLVHNSGFGKVDSLEEKVKLALELAKGVKSTATASKSKADEALKKVKKA